MRRTALVLVACAVAVPARAQQQGSVQLSTESQVVEGNPDRMAGEQLVQPDFGLLWTQPSARFGEFTLETRGTRRGDIMHFGRTWLGFRNAKAGGIAWTLQGGDLYAVPPADYQFTNLSAPAYTFNGALASAKTKRTTLQIVAGRSTALRNIFGSDPQQLGQTLGIVNGSFQPNARVIVNARAARTRTSSLREFTRTIDASDQAGGGVRLTVTPWLQLVGDGSYVRYRATGAAASTRDVSYLLGSHVLLSKGWLEVNASRFSPGDLPLVNAALQDRRGVFAAGEYDVATPVRLFGGFEALDTNIHPTGAALLRPSLNGDRGFGGVRFSIDGHSSLSFRVEQGGRVSQPVLTDVPTAVPVTTSDTGVMTAEFQTRVRALTAFGRYSRRSNVDSNVTSGSFTQQDTAGQVFLNVSRKTQLFGNVTVTHQTSLDNSASTFMQLSGGGQRQIFTPGLWLRVEGTASRNWDLVSRIISPRDALSVGVNGQLTRHTVIGVNVYMDRAPIGVGTDSAWLTRSTVRVVHSISTGSVRVPNATSAGGTIGRGAGSRGTGTILGSVFADWNANGQPDPGEELLPGIPLQLGSEAHVTTGKDGQFAFLNVPVGALHVGLDLAAIPVDYDVPPASDVIVELSRGDTRRVAFGLVPLGRVRGRVVQDVNGNGRADAGEPGVDGAVLTMDAGQRSEQAHNGAFAFEAVRAGDHSVELLVPSLPEGGVIVGNGAQSVTINHEHLQVTVTFLVRIQKRPEVRKVFPPKAGGGQTAAARGQSTGSQPRQASKTLANPPIRVPARGAATSTRGQSASVRGQSAAARAPGAPAFTIQIAALSDPLHARDLAKELKAAGFAAYVLDPLPTDPDGPYRVRVGHFVSRLAAQRMVTRLEARLKEKLWVTRALYAGGR